MTTIDPDDYIKKTVRHFYATHKDSKTTEGVVMDVLQDPFTEDVYLFCLGDPEQNFLWNANHNDQPVLGRLQDQLKVVSSDA